MARRAASPVATISVWRDEQGVVMVEYASVLLAVSLTVALAVGALGLPLFELFVFTQTIIAIPIP